MVKLFSWLFKVGVVIATVLAYTVITPVLLALLLRIVSPEWLVKIAAYMGELSKIPVWGCILILAGGLIVLLALAVVGPEFMRKVPVRKESSVVDTTEA